MLLLPFLHTFLHALPIINAIENNYCINFPVNYFFYLTKEST